jgi:branched-chain amino acid aminotransferase
MNRLIWKNGKIMSEENAVFSIYDSALMQGSIFEMTRSFNGKHFKLKEHIQRLYESAKYIGLNIPYTPDELYNACYELSDLNNHGENMEHRLIITASHGPLSIYNQIENIEMGPQTIITDIPLKWTVRGMGKFFTDGINLMTPSQRAIPSRIISNKTKHHNRLHFLRANLEVSKSKEPNTWALLLDDNGYLAECVGANIFIIKNDNILTPKTTNILKGISREYVMTELAKVTETDIDLHDAINADEIFITATPFCILPVTKLNGIQIGSGKIGNKTKYLIDRWSIKVNVNIPQQIIDWNKNDENITEGMSPYTFHNK